MSERKIPKVLIVGATLNESTGSGITLINLFKNFPRKNLAAIGFEDHTRLCSLKACPQVYQAGSRERKILFPFSIFARKDIFSGPITQKETRTYPSLPAFRITIYGLTRMLSKEMADIIGVMPIMKRFHISAEMDQWIREYNPDVVYSLLASMPNIKLTEEIAEKYGLPIAVHVLDDWPAVINKPGLMYYYWNREYKRTLNRIFGKAKLLLGISEGMRDEYKKKYGKEFIPFHNPIDTGLWSATRKKNLSIEDEASIVYLGSINNNNSSALRDVSKAVHELNQSGHKVKFDIYSFQHKTLQARKLKHWQGVNLLPPAQYHEIPQLVSKYDFALLALNFNHRSLKYTRLSFSTKASEYMASGIPTIIYASKHAEYSRHALKYGWAYAITERGVDNVKSALLKLINNKDLRQEISNRAVKYSEENCDTQQVASAFLDSFTKLINKNTPV